MAKIPRIGYSDRPSAVPGGGAGPGAPAAAGAGFAGAGAIASGVADILAVQEHAEATRLKQITDAKQAIVNEVEAGKRVGDFEEAVVGTFESGKTKFWDTPDKLPEFILAEGRKMLDRDIEQTSNSAVGLEMAQKGNVRLMATVREAHTWAQLRQTQKAKGDLTVIVNRATSGAESLASLPALNEYIKVKEAELRPMFERVIGAEAGAKITEMKTGMVQSWLNTYGNRDPLGGLAAIDSKTGPTVDYLNTAQREAARKDMKASFEGLTKTRDLDAIRAGIKGNAELADAFMSGSPQFAGIAFTQRRALTEQLKAVNAGLKFDQTRLESLGVDFQGIAKSEVPFVIQERIDYVDALEKARRRQTAFDAPDDPASVDALMLKMDKALASKNGKDMAAIVTQQKNVAVALSAEKISGATAQRMFKTMSLAMDTAASKQEGLWGPNAVQTFRAPREAGVAELNRQLGTAWANLPSFKGAGQFNKLPGETKTAIRLNYEGKFNTALEEGKALNALLTRKMALRAIAEETGQYIPGADN